MRYLLITLALVLLPLSCARSQPLLERGTAVTDPSALRELDRGSLGLSRMLSASSSEPLTDSALFALPAIVPVRKSLDEEFERYVQRHKRELPNQTIGVGPRFDFELFEYFAHTHRQRFVEDQPECASSAVVADQGNGLCEVRITHGRHGDQEMVGQV